MRTIWKYPLKVVDTQTIELPCGSEILSVKDKNGILTMWVELDTYEVKKQDVNISIVSTGSSIWFDTKYMESPKFLDSVVMGNFVWHVYVRKVI